MKYKEIELAYFDTPLFDVGEQVDIIQRCECYSITGVIKKQTIKYWFNY